MYSLRASEHEFSCLNHVFDIRGRCSFIYVYKMRRVNAEFSSSVACPRQVVLN